MVASLVPVVYGFLKITFMGSHSLIYEHSATASLANLCSASRPAPRKHSMAQGDGNFPAEFRSLLHLRIQVSLEA